MNPSSVHPSFFDDLRFLPAESTQNKGHGDLSGTSPCRDSKEHEEFPDFVLNCINNMLMEEDMDEKLDINLAPSALLAAEKSLYDALGEKYPPSPDQPPLYTESDSLDDLHFLPAESTQNKGHGDLSGTSPFRDAEEHQEFPDFVLNYINNMLMEEDMDEKLDIYAVPSALLAADKSLYDALGEKYPPSPDQPPLYTESDSLDSNGSSHSSGFHHPVPVDYSSQSSFCPSNSFGNNVPDSEESLVSMGWAKDVPIDSFMKGVKEARKFLPRDDKLMINLELDGFQLLREQKNESGLVKLKAEENKFVVLDGSWGRKNPHGEDSDLEEQRSNKHLAVYKEDDVRTEMFDQVLLCKGDKSEEDVRALREAVEKEASKNLQDDRFSRRKKQNKKKEAVDLTTLLIHCAQVVSTDDRRSANELLRQIRQHASPHGNASQRLAYYFANGLEARLAGTGSQIYNAFMSQRRSASDVLRAYQLYLSACPFKRLTHFVANHTIKAMSQNAARVHVVDFGIHYGFQWPCYMQILARRPGGPPKLRITGIETPQPGFRPAEFVEETGRRLADYAKSFNVPFEYHPIAAKWETIKPEDIRIEKDEFLVVNCVYRLENLADETVTVDCPRNKLLNTIWRLNPDLFIQAHVNGTFSAPFFVTRFREVLFHFSAMFDMLEMNVPRDHPQRVLIERELFGRQVLNVIACEGLERVERPETYKQWQVRNLRAGFVQLPLNSEITRRAMTKVKTFYHKDFIIMEDGIWLLQGWKGRITYALSAWKPRRPLQDR